MLRELRNQYRIIKQQRKINCSHDSRFTNFIVNCVCYRSTITFFIYILWSTGSTTVNWQRGVLIVQLSTGRMDAACEKLKFRCHVIIIVALSVECRIFCVEPISLDFGENRVSCFVTWEWRDAYFMHFLISTCFQRNSYWSHWTPQLRYSYSVPTGLWSWITLTRMNKLLPQL